MSRSAAEFFSTKVLEPSEKTDFRTERSDIIIKSQYHSYELGETLEAKIARLTKEVAEVQQEIASDAKNSQFIESDRQLDNLADLESALKKIHDSNTSSASSSAKDIKISLASGPETQLQVKSISKITQATSSQISKISEVENRVAVLEKVLGLDELDTSSEAYRPVLLSLQEIRQRLKLITSSPASLEASASNLKKVIEIVEKIKALKLTRTDKPSELDQHSNINGEVVLSRSLDGATFLNLGEFASNGLPKDAYDKINKLYSKIPSVEKFEIILPKVLSRLRLLRDLHADALSTQLSVDEFDKLILAMKSDMKEWKKSLNIAQQKLEQLEVTSSQNKSEINEWTNNLKKQLQANK